MGPCSACIEIKQKIALAQAGKFGIFIEHQYCNKCVQEPILYGNRGHLLDLQCLLLRMSSFLLYSAVSIAIHMPTQTSPVYQSSQMMMWRMSARCLLTEQRIICGSSSSWRLISCDLQEPWGGAGGLLPLLPFGGAGGFDPAGSAPGGKP